MSEELKEKIEHILGTCKYTHHGDCWWSDRYSELKKSGVEEEYREGKIGDLQPQALLELFEQYVLEIIGEDETHKDKTELFKTHVALNARNELRREQRSRLESQKKDKPKGFTAEELKPKNWTDDRFA